MTPQEQQMIQSLISRVNQTRLSDKDPAAEQLLEQSLGQNPDVIYILSQTVLVQDYALQQAQKQLADLRQQLDQSRQQQHTSFLGNLLGHKDPPPPPPARPAPQIQPPPQNYSQPAYAPVPNYAPAPSSGFGSPTPAGGGFLQGAMQTAAGVAAGALAFEGVESLMHGFGHAAGYGSDNLGGFGGGSQPREEVINNYYGDSADRDANTSDRSDFDSAADNNGSLSPDLEDRRDDLANDPNDSGDPGDSGASGFDDNSGFDDSSDGGSFDGGGDDSNFS